MSANVLVIAAHPDDEVLGCGGTIARHALAGDRCCSLILSEGATARDERRDPAARDSELKALKEAAGRAAWMLGGEPPRFAAFPDNRLDSVALLDIVKEIEEAIRELQPTTIYTHHGGDLNMDHRLVHRAVLTACRPLPAQPVRAVYAFETVSSTEWGAASQDQAFIPTRYVDVAAVFERKMEALRCYQLEMREFPHARSLENVTALARYRGASAGLEAAEAFMTVREVVR